MSKKTVSLAVLLSLIAGLAIASQLLSADNQQGQPDVVEPLTSQLSNVSAKLSSDIKNTAMSQVTGVTVEPEPPLVASARQQIGVTTSYDPAYVSLDFPMGDVPINTGVCTDVVVRAYRNLATAPKDLQALVNSDMKQTWDEYPKIWGLSRPDPNIDHRRVPNLQTFFARHGDELAISDNGEDYKAGDIVTWSVAGRPHIGIVSNKRLANGTPLIIHNIGRGTQEEDILFSYPITGHYRYAP